MKSNVDNVLTVPWNCAHNVYMQNTEALATKTANEAARRFLELIAEGKDVQRAMHLVIREATEYHPTCGMMVAAGLASLVAA